MKVTAGQHSTEHSGTTSTGVLLGGVLAFSPSVWIIQNLGTVPLRFSLDSTTPTTGNHEVPPGVTHTLPVPSNTYSVLTTSSSTDGSDWRRVRLLGVGG